MKRDPVIFLVVAFAITIMLVFGYKVASRRPVADSIPVLKGLGKPAPDFTLKTTDGQTLRLSDFRGKAVVVNFWATWCDPCKIEIPWFVAMQKQYGPNGLQILGISMDEDTSPKDLSRFAQDLGVNYPILLSKDEVAQAYGGIDGLPVTVYVDRDGNVVDKVFGLRGRGDIETDIKKALAQGGQATRAQR